MVLFPFFSKQVQLRLGYYKSRSPSHFLVLKYLIGKLAAIVDVL
jgi:hypothetical protein